ncbi:MAG: TonB-dependent receptor [Candidatus Micropelagos thuwalensis]
MLLVQKILGAKSPRLLTSFFVGMSVFASSGAFAQIDEVIVRASKRETNLQSTPIAVSAIQAEDVNSLVARDIGDVAVLAPNFSAAKITGFNAAGFSMRGAGQTDIIVYSDPQVGVAIDDFIVPHVQTQLLDVFDIEQVEVLRGPQGTLFGKNTTAGMVTLRTKRPELDETDFKLNVRLAEYGREEIRVAMNIPVTDKIAVRASGLFAESDGYYQAGGFVMNAPAIDPTTNLFTSFPPADGTTGDGRSLGGEDVFSGRFKVLYEATDNLTALLQYEIIRDDSDAVPSINETPTDIDPATGATRFAWAGPLFNAPVQAGDPLNNAASTDRDDNLLNMSQGHQVDVDGIYLNLEYAMDKGNVFFMAGTREQDSRLPSTYTGVNGTLSLFDANRADQRETTQYELRYASDLGGNLEYVTGIFMQEDDTTFCVTQVLGFLDYFAGVGFAPAFPGTYNNTPLVLCNAQQQEAQAVFIDATYDVSDRLTLSGGFRYTEEEKAWIGRNRVPFQSLTGGFDVNLTAATIGGPLAAADFTTYSAGVLGTDQTWEEDSYRFTASYQVSDDVFSYITYARGFKSGAFNDQTGTVAALSAANIAPTNPEYADSIEIGLKSDLFDNQLRLNVAAFNVEYTDAQRQIAATFGNDQETRFFNAAEATVNGIETEFTFVPAKVPGLTIQGNLSLQDGDFDKFEADTNFDGTIDVDFSDRPLTRTPEVQAALQVSYEQDYGDITGQAVMTIFHEDDQVNNYSDLGEAYDTVLESKTLIDVSYALIDNNNNYSVRAFVKNATDERYRVSSQPVATLWVFSQYGPPRTAGVEMTFDF